MMRDREIGMMDIQLEKSVNDFRFRNLVHDVHADSSRLCGTFVDYFPRALVVFSHPVLTFSHFVREIITRVFLIEIDYCQILSSRVEKHANIADSHLDPAFGGIHLALVLCHSARLWFPLKKSRP